MPAAKKDPSTRRRVNKTSTRATLTADHQVQAPPMPLRVEWHPMAIQWWAAIWSSPMATEYVEADHQALYRLLVMVQDFWMASSPSDRQKLSAEIRLQQVNFGLTPYDRRRLEWTIEQTDEAQARGRQRRETAAPPQPTAGPAKSDPRNVLRAV
jgi:hypothetical protein